MADEPDSDDRTEEPTQRKLDEAIKRGDVAKSQEINTLFVLGGFTLALAMLSGSITQALDGEPARVPHERPSGSAGRRGVRQRSAAGALGGSRRGGTSGPRHRDRRLLGGGLQHRPLWTFEPLTPKFNRISPMSGAKRIYGKEAWVQFLKGLLKIAIVGGVASTVLWNERDRLESFARIQPGGVLPALLALALKLLAGVLAIYAFMALGDAVYQRMAWLKRQRMSKQELKEDTRTPKAIRRSRPS